MNAHPPNRPSPRLALYGLAFRLLRASLLASQALRQPRPVAEHRCDHCRRTRRTPAPLELEPVQGSSPQRDYSPRVEL